MAHSSWTLPAQDDYEPGWKIAVRYDLGPLSVFEATYMGLYDMACGDEVAFGRVPIRRRISLFSLFSELRHRHADTRSRRCPVVQPELRVGPAEHRTELPPLLGRQQSAGHRNTAASVFATCG